MKQTEVFFISKLQQQRPKFTGDSEISNWRIYTKQILDSWFDAGYIIKEQIDLGEVVCLIFVLKDV